MKNSSCYFSMTLTAALLWGAPHSRAQNEPSAAPPPSASSLFPDKVIAKGKGVEVMQSELDEMFITFRANRAAVGQQVPESMRGKIEREILDKLIATQIFLNRATDADKEKGKELSAQFIEEQKADAPSEESFQRQLRALGMTPEKFREQVFEQAVVKAVIDREIRSKLVVTDSEVREFYDSNPRLFEDPEMVRVSHILFSTIDAATGQEISLEQKKEKRELAQTILGRAKAGADFAKLVELHSEDRLSKMRGGEYTIARAKDDPNRSVVPEFEAAAFALAVGQISDLVATRYGFHVIKLLEKIPPRKTELSKAEFRIRETLLQEKVQKALPEHVEKLKKEAGVEILADLPNP